MLRHLVLVALALMASAQSARAVDTPCWPKYADANAAAPEAGKTYVLVGVPIVDAQSVSFIVSPFVPETNTLIYGGEQDPNKSICFNRDKVSWAAEHDGITYNYHLVEAVPQTYATESWIIRGGLDWYSICLAEDAYAFDIKPGRINYIGDLVFKHVGPEIRDAARSGPGYKAVFHGAPFGIERIDQNVEAARAGLKAFPGIAAALEKTENRHTTFTTKQNWLGTDLCYSTTERPRPPAP